MIAANPLIAAMAPYPRVAADAASGQRPILLNQNESYRPASPSALAAARQAVGNERLYSDSECSALRQAIGAVHGLDRAMILCAAGSMELIAALTRVFTGPERRILTTQYAYAYLATTAAAAGAPREIVAEPEFCVSVDALLAAVRPDTALVFIANPGNPTGTRLPRGEVVRLRDGLPAGTLLVVDEAYGEFADHLDTPVFDLAAHGDTVVLRTFSKAYGLAGARVGWGAFAPAIADEVRKVLNPGGISSVSLAAAEAAMRDQDYMRETCRETARLRDRFAARLRGIGLGVLESHTNFVLILFAGEDAASRADRTLRERGIVMRGMAGYGLPQALRCTIGTAADMDQAFEVLAGIGDEEGFR